MKQNIKIEKNINHLNKLLTNKLKYFAYLYGRNLSFNHQTIKTLKNKKIDSFV
jgi:hypothetical protein|tara:strand:- start:177 stop:335 length:159 start_codon:yes stop_codon:yes gene_type:complete